MSVMYTKTRSSKQKTNMRTIVSTSLTPGMAFKLYVFLTLLWLDISQACDKSKILQDETYIKKMITQADIAVKGLITNTYHDEQSTKKDAYIAELWLLDVYKGAYLLDENIGIIKQTEGGLPVRDRRLNISHWRDDLECWEKLVNQKTYIIMMQSNTDENEKQNEGRMKRLQMLQNHFTNSESENNFGGAVEFTQELEKKILNMLGWNPWGEWTSCSSSCGGGKQERKRTCNSKPLHVPVQGSSYTRCTSYDIEQRMCNSFSCKGTVNALSVKESRYFKPSPGAFHRVEGRSAAWMIKPGSYFLLPFKQAFGQTFPRDTFTIFLTIKPSKESEGVIFSLNARNSRQEHISLELKEGRRIELVHSLPNGSNIIDIPAKISDGKWHQLAISIDRGSSVRTYLDCNWITTQILHKHSLVVPTDTDLIVGYMFQGEIEQLTISKDSSAVSEQCSATRIPISTDDTHMYAMQGDDPNAFKDSTHGDRKPMMDYKKSSQTKDPYDYLEEEYVDLDRNDLLSKTPKKENLKYTSKEENLKVAKTSTSFANEKDHNIEGSGEHDFNMLNDDEDSLDNNDKLIEGSGAEFKISSSQIIHHQYNEVTNHINKEAPNVKYELEWSTWSDCYIVSKDKKRYNRLLSGKPHKKFSECGIQKFSGRQYRTSRCLDNGYMEECIAAGKEHKRQTRKCTPSCKQVFLDAKPPKYLYDDNAVVGITPKVNKLATIIQRKSEDYELVTNGDVEEVKRRSLKSLKRRFLEEKETKRDKISLHNQANMNTEIPNESERYNHINHSSKSQHIKISNISAKDPFNNILPDVTKISSKPDANGGRKLEDRLLTNISLSLDSVRDNVFRNPSNCICKHGGVCKDGACHCKTGYSGRRCETPICRPNCLNGGECVDVDVCNCKNGYTGARCETAFCHPECLNGGSCVAPFKCACPLGVSGMYCQEFSCQNKCANGGFCIGQNTCSCPHGFSGSLCQDRTCTIHCENGGVCTMPGNKCKCRNGFYGSRCHKRICKTYVSIMKPHRQLYKRVVNVEYDSICGKQNLPCKKFRPEHRTFIKIIQRPSFVCKSDIVGKT